MELVKDDEQNKEELTLEAIWKDPKYKDLVSEFDRKVSEGINTYKKNSFQSEVEKKAAELAEKLVIEREEKKKIKTPEQIQLEELLRSNRELAEKFSEKDKAEKRNALKAEAIKELAQSQMPLDLLEFVITDDEETSKKNTELLKKVFSEFATKIKQNNWAENNNSVPPNKLSTTSGTLKEPAEDAGEQAWKDYWKAVRAKK